MGCATGLFMEVAREADWRVEGMDISHYALSRAREKGLSVRAGALPNPELESGEYDVVTLWDVIEHVTDPAAVIADCHRLLRPGGVLAMSTPDAGSRPAKILAGRWLGFRSIDEHLYFFSRDSMRAMLERGGFHAARFHAVGKHLSLRRLVARMRFYSKIAAFLLRTVDRVMPNRSLYVNPHDTMCVIAVRDEAPAPRSAPV